MAPTYAPAGASLINTTILDKTHDLSDEDLNNACIEQLSLWFGSQVFKWKPLKILRIANAHPAIYPDRLCIRPIHLKSATVFMLAVII